MTWPPITMATQHPDNAGVPWWRKDAFISTQDEIEELQLSFEELGIDEYMWDWEGKHVDEAVGEKLFARAMTYFRRHPLGRAHHLTYRIPAFDGERMHRMARAFMNVLSLADLKHDIGLPCLPVTEMFLPLTESASQPMKVRKVFKEVAEFHRRTFHGKGHSDSEIVSVFEVTPLVEDVASLLSIEKIIEPYWKSLKKEGKDLQGRGQRIFLARSDPALNAGLVPAVLAVKVALSTAHRLGTSLGIAVHPIIGTGSLPFRGSVNPLYVDEFLEQYGGVATYSIQSAFRYDYPIDQVSSALKIIKHKAPRQKVMMVPEKDRQAIIELCSTFASLWRSTIEKLAPLINDVAQYVPARRERMQHIGLFGYSRGVGKVKLPRAITFTAALYSLGIPPELIATGRGLREAIKRKQFHLIEKYYPALRADLQHAGKYLNRENLSLLKKTQPVFADIEDDVKAIEDLLGITLKPEKPYHTIHRNITSTILHRLKHDSLRGEITQNIVEAGVIRRSLG